MQQESSATTAVIGGTPSPSGSGYQLRRQLQEASRPPSARTCSCGRAGLCGRAGEDIGQPGKHQRRNRCGKQRRRPAAEPEGREADDHASQRRQLGPAGIGLRSRHTAQRRPELRMVKEPLFKPRRRPCEAGGGENEEWRRRQHRKKCADRAESDADKTESEIDLAHRLRSPCAPVRAAPMPMSFGASSLKSSGPRAGRLRGLRSGCDVFRRAGQSMINDWLLGSTQHRPRDLPCQTRPTPLPERRSSCCSTG